MHCLGCVSAIDEIAPVDAAGAAAAGAHLVKWPSTSRQRRLGASEAQTWPMGETERAQLARSVDPKVNETVVLVCPVV